MKKIPLTKNQTAIVDKDDFEWVNKWKWQAAEKRSGHFYATRVTTKKNIRTEISMGRMILGISDKKIFVDHINGNPLDNRRKNLRAVSAQQNSFNRKRRNNSCSEFKGVHPSGKKWRAGIWVTKKNIHIGTFITKEEAAIAYNFFALRYFGEFARLNNVSIR